ncbi:hypothetical protein Tco_0733362 [Tanacetum coccineum]
MARNRYAISLVVTMTKSTFGDCTQSTTVDNPGATRDHKRIMTPSGLESKSNFFPQLEWLLVDLLTKIFQVHSNFPASAFFQSASNVGTRLSVLRTQDVFPSYSGEGNLKKVFEGKTNQEDVGPLLAAIVHSWTPVF